MESLEAELPERLTSESEELVPEYKKNPEMEMPTVEINGQECIGTLEIPSLGLKFPVISEWSDEKLKKAPCRYSG
ncbi:sortase, partial [Xanthomonas citri pv. citri]|nr:sortase [Xanthomonas citri pv. citri]